MLSVYVPKGTSLQRIPADAGEAPPEAAVWVDLVTPTLQEDKLVERMLGIAVPTREEMQEIEVSSRLYVENGARYMTATLMCHSDTMSPKTTPVTFILANHRLVTVRYDAVIDRAADIQERVGAEIDQISHTIFEPDDDMGPPSYNDVLKALGRKGDLTSKVRESLVSIGRLLLFLANEAEAMKWPKDTRTQLSSMQRDVISLTDHASYLTNKITFLLDAMLGVVNIQQNNIIKIFSVAAVVLMPPTLIASIYGMNFKHMPELDWHFGYPLAIGVMLLAAALPYLYFKWKKWL
jgi:magnesium transporter